MLRTAILASLTALAVAASPAVAAVRRADHLATSRFLPAATAYVKAEVAGAAQYAAALDTVTAHVNSTCPRTLAANPASTTAQQDVEYAFALAAGLETGLAALQTLAAPSTAYVHRLAGLRWSSPALNRAAAYFVRSREGALALTSPDLCAEVAAAAATGFATVPARTAAFIAAAQRLAGPPSVGNLLTLMKPYLTPAEKTKATRLRRLENRLLLARQQAQGAAVPRLQTALIGR